MAKRILLVEDNEGVRKTFGESLQHDGYIVVLAGDGEEAWQILKCGEKFDLILSDKDMPKMNGLELLERVRGDQRTSDIPFILASGNWTVSKTDQTPLEVVCAPLGAEFVEKPFDCSAVVARLLGDA